MAAGLTSAIEELREISQGIHPAILSNAGLRPALHAGGTFSITRPPGGGTTARCELRVTPIPVG